MSSKLWRIAAALIILVVVTITIVAYGADNDKQLDESSIIIETEVETKEEQQIIIIENENPLEKKIAKSFINVRTTPEVKEDNIYTQISRGTEVEVSTVGDGWYKIHLDQNDYYIWSEGLVTPEEWEEINKYPYSEQVPLSAELQEYLWNECKDLNVDYCFALAIIDRETEGTFNPNSISKTSDYGLFQCNKCWKSTFKKLGLIQNGMEDLLNPYNSIHAGLYLLSQYFAEYGVSEATAYKYNRGHASSNSSNAYSRDVVYNLYPKWKSIIEGAA